MASVRSAPDRSSNLIPCVLTIHSSRSRFAARLNSGVRPLLLKQFLRQQLASRGVQALGIDGTSRLPVCASGLAKPQVASSFGTRWADSYRQFRPNKSFKPNPLRGFVLNDSAAPLSRLTDSWRVGLIPALGRMEGPEK